MAPKAKCKASQSGGLANKRRASPSSFRRTGQSNASNAISNSIASKGGAPFRPKPHDGPHDPHADSAALNSLAALFTHRRAEVTCEGCGISLSDGQPTYSPGDDGKCLCRGCASATLVAKYKRCSVCNGRFGPGHQIFQSPTDANMFACEACVSAMQAAAEARPQQQCGDCQQALAPGIRVFISRGMETRYLCQECAEVRNCQKPTNCSSCQTPLHGTRIYRSNEDASCFLCETCREASLPRCAACGLQILGRIAMLADRAFHFDCLRCADCSAKISPVDGASCFQTARGLLVCRGCRNERLLAYGLMLP